VWPAAVVPLLQKFRKIATQQKIYWSAEAVVERQALKDLLVVPIGKFEYRCSSTIWNIIA
jgi:hypothetical protein